MFGKLGANVVVNDVTKDGAEKVVKEVKAGRSHIHVSGGGNCVLMDMYSRWTGCCCGMFG